MNAIHITTEDQCLVVALDQLAGGTAKDYADHIIHSIEHLARVFSDFHELEFKHVYQTMCDHVACSMTDRAAANHAAIRIVNEQLGKSIIEVNCHLHPLDTITSKCKSVLLSMESQKSKLYGTGCLAEKIVLALNKMRYKDGKGDPHGFRVFLQDHHLPQSLLARYRGNRLHVLFKLAATHITYYDEIKLYLTTRCLNTSTLKSALIEDFCTPSAYLQLKCLAVLGKLLTGPWMKRFYRNNHELHHMDAFVAIKGCFERVKELASQEVIHLESLTVDFFGEDLVKDQKNIWTSDVPNDQFSEMLKSLLAATMQVIQNQYKRYYEMEDMSHDELQKLNTARTHNMDSEELMGMFSALHARAPRATLIFNSSKIRAKKNKTFQYLKSCPNAEQLVQNSITAAAKLKRNTQKSVLELQKELSARIADKMQKKQNTDRRKTEKKVKDLMKMANADFSTAFSLDVTSTGTLEDIVRGRIVGMKIMHNWAQKGKFVDKTYNGKVEKLKKTKTPTYVICYWELGQEYDEDGEDFNIPVHELAVDFICGDFKVVH